MDIMMGTNQILGMEFGFPLWVSWVTYRFTARRRRIAQGHIPIFEYASHKSMNHGLWEVATPLSNQLLWGALSQSQSLLHLRRHKDHWC